MLRAAPRLLVVTAPAGYGKTTIGLAYARTFRRHAVIDLARMQTPRALLLALLQMLQAQEGNDAYLRQAQLSLAAEETVPVVLAERILDAWNAAGKLDAVLFDNAERLPAQLLALFNTVLERRPPQTACIVCSRSALALQTSRIASPVDVLRLATADLQLSGEQTREIFADAKISPDSVKRVLDLAHGWPLATLLLRRLHDEGRLDDVLTRAGQSEDLQHFYEFIQDEVIGTLTPAQQRTIEFCGRIPDARITDVGACLGTPAVDALLAAGASLPLLRIDGERIEVHPLLKAALSSRANPSAAQDLRDAAQAAFMRGERDLAAARYIASGDRQEAVKVLDAMLERGANAAVATLAASLDHEVLERNPRWFAIAALLRRYDVPPAQNLASVQAHRAHAEQTGDEVARFAIAAAEAHQLLHCGFPEQALERFRELEDLLAVMKRGGIANMLRAHVAARFYDTLRAAYFGGMGDAAQAERLLKRSRFTLGQFPMVTLSAAIDGWLSIAMLRGDVRLARLQCARARESLTRAGLDIVLLDLDANEAFAGWLLGDDAMYEQAMKRVDARARAYRLRAFDHLLGCAGLRAECEPTGLETLRRLVIAHLIAAADIADERGLEHAQRALLFARELRQPLFVSIAAIAVRERGGDPDCEPGETLALAPHTEASLRSRMRGHAPPHVQTIHLELLSDPIRCGERTVELSVRERDMLLLLALAHRECSSAVLAEQLGDADEPLTIAGVHTLIHRVRKRFPIDILESSPRGYALHAPVRTDIRDLEDLLRSLPPQPDELWRRRLRAALQTLCNALASGRNSGKLLPAFEQFVRTSAARLAAYLAEDAFTREDADAVLDVAEQLREADPCDEAACELAIRAHIVHADQESALRAYQSYEQTLSRELASEPSPHLTALLQSMEQPPLRRSPSTSQPS